MNGAKNENSLPVFVVVFLNSFFKLKTDKRETTKTKCLRDVLVPGDEGGPREQDGGGRPGSQRAGEAAARARGFPLPAAGHHQGPSPPFAPPPPLPHTVLSLGHLLCAATAACRDRSCHLQLHHWSVLPSFGQIVDWV